MLKFYRCYYETINKGQMMYGDFARVLVDENDKPQNETIQITWDDLEQIHKKYGIYVGFNVWTRKKGRIISFFEGSIIFKKEYEKDLKEWKEKDLDLQFKVSVKEYTPSIQEVLDWHDGEKAIQYLKERGLSVQGQA